MYLVEFNVKHVVPNTGLKRRFLSLQSVPVMQVTDLHVQYQEDPQPDRVCIL